MKILLILPAAAGVRVTADRPQALPRAMLRFSVLPLTVVAALTPREHEVTLCDENVEPIDFDRDVDVVGITFMTALAPRAYEIAAAFRARGRIVVAGGYHPTFCPDEVAAHVDAVVIGEAEPTWPRVLADIAAGRLQRVYRAAPCDLAAAPVPRRDLTRRTAAQYVTVNAVQAGRGCAHGCRYCSVTAFHRQSYRARPVDHVIAEIKTLPRHFMFVDDNIIADPDYARALFRAMVPLRKLWVSQCSLRLADDPELLRLAWLAGCRGLFIGIETLDDANLAAVGKSVCNRAGEYRDRIGRIRRQGIGVIAGMIVGMDHDDVTVFERSLRFLDSVGIDALQLNIMTPLPGTPLFADFLDAGRITDLDWGHYDFRHTVMRPAHMTADELQGGTDWLLRQFYRPDRIVRRVLRTGWTCGLLPAWLALRLNLTYRRDVVRLGLQGCNPAAETAAGLVTAWRGRRRPAVRTGVAAPVGT